MGFQTEEVLLKPYSAFDADIVPSKPNISVMMNNAETSF